ncbi:hypothetical protein AB0F43_33505 [Kribbella sp. NPDC023972]|uniref:hypothetical protein n=1 Tax=Kribbella sp. NPDC023972 TaxID=3154795 RepID=UPI0034057CC8
MTFPMTRPSGCPFDPAREYADFRRTDSTGASRRCDWPSRSRIRFKDNTLVYGVTALPVTGE